MPKTSPQLKDYEVVEAIGTGSFGTCSKVLRKSDRKVMVWKEVGYGGMSEREKQLLVQEVNLLRELRHPHIVRYYDRIIHKETSTLYIIMEYCEGGDLGGVIKESKEERKMVEEDVVWRVLHQLLLALRECHKKRDGVHKVLHRDIKPANVFLDKKGDVKLGDFGLARILHHNFSLAHTFIGTPYYMSPELFSDRAYDEKSDLWSLGCLVHELCTLTPPFRAKDQTALAAKVLSGKAGRIPQPYSSTLQNIIDSLLESQPSCRPDIESLLWRVERGRRQRGRCPQPFVTQDPAPQIMHDLRRWERQLQAREEELARREAEMEKREREVREKEKELRRKEKALEMRLSALYEEEHTNKENKKIPTNEQYNPHKLKNIKALI